MSTARLYTVVRVKSAVPRPVHGSPVWVLAVSATGEDHEWRTTDDVRVGDQYSIETHIEPVAVDDADAVQSVPASSSNGAGLAHAAPVQS